MDPFSMVVMIVLIAGGVTVVTEYLKRGGGKANQSILNELRFLREEVHQLRQQQNDVLLNLDSGIQRLDQRVNHLETRKPLEAGAPENVVSRNA